MKIISALIAIIMTASFFGLFKSSGETFKPATDLPLKLYHSDGDKFIIIGHRGASAYAPENSLSAFKLAYEMGAEMIELDVLLSKDGVPVVIHDETLDRTSNGSGPVADHSLEELKKLDAGSWFSEKYAGEPIPTLEEVLAWAKGKISVNIEIKTEAVTDQAAGGIEQKSLELVEKFGMSEYVIFSSFDYRAIAHLNELNPEMPKAILFEKSQGKGKGPTAHLTEYDIQGFNCSYRQISEEWMQQARDNSLPVLIYTVNDADRMRSLWSMGVSGIFSDKPDVLKETVEKLWENN